MVLVAGWEIPIGNQVEFLKDLNKRENSRNIYCAAFCVGTEEI